MAILEITGHVDENHRLSADLPTDVPIGPVKIIIRLPGEEEEDPAAWSRAIGQLWRADWSDPREDIYSLEDGKPVDGSR